MLKEYRECIRMSKAQFEELKRFYEKLGYSSDQVKKLTKSCFGAEIIVDKSAVYEEDWEFYRRRKTLFDTAAKGKQKGFELLRCAPPAGAVMTEMDEEVMAEPMVSAPMMASAMSAPMMAMPDMMGMPGMGAAAGMMGMRQPMEFSAAETHDAKEIEEASPLDNPQLIFSANVNTASWSYLRSNINTRRRIDPSFVRIEEIINSYHYKLKKPTDDALFSVTVEQGKCPWNKENELLLVGLRGKKADKDVKQNIALLIDVSGSMSERWLLVQMSAAAIISKLKKGDFLSIIAYSDDTVTVAEKIPCDNMDKCVKALLSVDGIGGCTNGSDGLENAYAFLKDNYNKDGNNRIFIFTDGDFNFGVTSEGGLGDYIRKKKETGIYLSIVGYGRENFKDNKMETLARNGNGNYTFIANPGDILEQLWKKLISNLVTVAKDVKISVELNPQLVEQYRLIGYDARVLTQQEFHDTEKAVDGMGSDHNVVAMIELRKGKAAKKYSTRYVSTSAGADTNEFAFIEIHYKTPEDENKVFTKAVTVDELAGGENKNMPVATLLAGFGLLVKQSEYKGEMSKDMLKEMLAELGRDKKYDLTEKNSHFEIISRYLERY